MNPIIQVELTRRKTDSTIRAPLLLTTAFVLLVFGASGCGYDPPSAPDSQNSPPPGAEGAQITITSSGFTPSSVTVATGQSVTFVNSDAAAHDIVSGPAPTYDECPSINRVGQLAPGQSMPTGAFNEVRTCSFLDLAHIGDSRWQGTVTIQ